MSVNIKIILKFYSDPTTHTLETIAINTSEIPKPFIKWVGGKSQIIKEIIKTFPSAPIKINNYREIFLGGGSVLFAVLYLIKENKVIVEGKLYACDFNPILIQVYKDVQKNKDKLFACIQEYINSYKDLPILENSNRKPKTLDEAKTSKESYYYWLRTQFNQLQNNHIKKSALFIFLNKTCFRGVYREGPHGFNVPYGHYKKTPTIITKETLDCISNLIKDVEFTCCDFRDSINNAQPGDFMYLDPPYAPLNETSFVGYNKKGFGLQDHKDLFALINNLTDKQVRVCVSNAKVPLVMDSFDKQKYTIKELECRRAIHSKNPGAKAVEVIITNYL